MMIFYYDNDYVELVAERTLNKEVVQRNNDHVVDQRVVKFPNPLSKSYGDPVYSESGKIIIPCMRLSARRRIWVNSRKRQCLLQRSASSL